MAACGYKQTIRPRRRNVRFTPDSRHSSADHFARRGGGAGDTRRTPSRPQDSALSAAAAQWEPRKPWAAQESPDRSGAFEPKRWTRHAVR